MNLNDQKLVFVVEDEQKTALHIERWIKEAGYLTQIIADGANVLEEVKNRKPDFIILDIKLPNIDGFAITSMIRRNKETSHIPILILSSRSSVNDKIQALDLGADDYLSKPFSVGELQSRIKTILKRGRKNVVTEEDLIFNDLRINLTGYKVLKNGVEIPFSKREFELLAYLVTNKGYILSRDLILSHVWGEDIITNKRTVDTHIRWIRQKIEDDPNNPTRIVSVRNVGYRFDE